MSVKARGREMTQTKHQAMFHGLWVGLLTLLILPAQADPTQVELFNAGLFLGWAKGQMDLEGQGANATVKFNLSRARECMEQAEQMFDPAFREIRKNHRCLAQTLKAIKTYIKKSDKDSAQTNIEKLMTIYTTYREGFTFTYRSDRSDEHPFTAMCDLRILETGFKLGQAWIAAGRAGDRAHHQLRSRLAEMNAIIQDGIKTSVDKENLALRADSEREPHVLCCFGSKSAWDRVPRLHQNSSVLHFEQAVIVMRQVVAGAGVPDCGCDSLVKSEPGKKGERRSGGPSSQGSLAP